MYDHDMFGLDAGDDVGDVNKYLIGAAVGPLVSATTSTVLSSVLTEGAMKDRNSTSATMIRYRHGLGALASAAVGAAMFLSPKTKAVGKTTLVSGLAAGLFAHIGDMIVQSQMEQSAKEAVTAAATSEGFGYATINPAYPVHSGLGIPTIAPAYPVHAGLGAARPELVGPPTLVGAGDYGLGQNPAVAQTKLLGGPSISALGAHYGATLFGHNA